MTAPADVKVTMTAEVAAALRAWQEMQKGPAKFGEELEKTGRKGGQAARSMGTDLDQLIGKWVSFQVVINLARQAIVGTAEAQRKMQSEFLRTQVTAEQAFTDMFIQMGPSFTGPENAARRQPRLDTVKAVAEARKIPSITPVAQAATQLVSMAIPEEEVFEKGGLNEFIKLMNATNQRPEQFGRLARATGQLIGGAKAPKTAETIREVAIALSALFRDNPIEVNQLEQFASRSGGLTTLANIPLMQQVALFATLQAQGLGSELATTQLKNVARILSAPNETQRARIAKAGIDPEAVDFEGEDFAQVFAEITKARKRLGPTEFKQFAVGVFGENIEAALSFVEAETQALFQKNRQRVERGEAGFESAVAFRERSLPARQNALALQKELDRLAEPELGERALRRQAVENRLERMAVDDPSALQLPRAGIPGLTSAIEGVGISEEAAREVASAILTPELWIDALLQRFGVGGLLPRSDVGNQLQAAADTTIILKDESANGISVEVEAANPGD
jgi:hypothetical protein